jgi:hypothetical protein
MAWAVIGDYTIYSQGGLHPASAGVALVLTAICTCFSVLLYKLRRTHLFWYGCIEIVVGLVVQFFAFVPLRPSMSLNPQTTVDLGVLTGIGVLGGIYIIVRGLDNIDNDLPPTWRPHWDRFFPKRKQS